MRAAYLSLDRPDIQFTCKELARGVSQPRRRHWKQMKRLARYLRSRPRVVQLIPNQGHIKDIVAWVDADHAGCIRTCKSTSGGV
eukprot:6262018-Prorocentrum_lima.AAC.1